MFIEKILIKNGNIKTNSTSKIIKIIEISWSELIIFNYFFNFINNIYLRKFLDFLSYIYIIQIIEIFIIILILIIML